VILGRIFISLDVGDEAKVYDEKGRLQPQAYDQAYRYLCRCRDQVVDAVGKDSRHIHNAIFIDGARGAGKTAFMLNLGAFFNKRDEKKSDERSKGPLHFLSPIDPTLLQEQHDFLSIVIGHIHGEVNKKKPDAEDGYYRALSAVGKALSSIDGVNDIQGIEKVLAYQMGSSLEDKVYEYSRQACNLLGVKAIVVPVDDVDMAIGRAYEILDVVRRMFSCPYIIPVIAGDFSMYLEILCTNFLCELLPSGDPGLGRAIASNGRYIMDDRTKLATIRANQLAEEYLRKVLPPPQRIKLKSIPELIEEHEVVVGVNGRSDNGVLLKDFLSFLQHVLFRHTNGIEDSRPSLTPQTARELSQFLVRLRPIFDKAKLSEQMPSLSQARDAALIQPIVLEAMKPAESGEHELLQQALEELREHFRSLEETERECLAAADLQLLAIVDALKPNAEAKERPLFDLPFFNPQMSPEKSKNYFSVTVAGERIPTVIRCASNFPDVEMHDYQRIFSKSMVVTASEKVKILACIYSHNEYYTSHQTGLLVLFGKAFEILVNSLFGCCTSVNLRKILWSPPYHSYFHYFPTKAVNPEPKDQKTYEVEGEESQADGVSGRGRWNPSDATIDEFAKEINDWYQERPWLKTKLLPSAQFIYKVMNKTFTQISALERNSHFIRGVSLSEVNERFRRIILNSFASFESSSPRVVLQNSGIARNLGIYENDNVYTINVSPLLVSEEPSITKAIFSHPLFTMQEGRWTAGEGQDGDTVKIAAAMGARAAAKDVSLQAADRLVKYTINKIIGNKGDIDAIIFENNHDAAWDKISGIMSDFIIRENKKFALKILMSPQSNFSRLSRVLNEEQYSDLSRWLQN
jgi:hypothetical protein